MPALYQRIRGALADRCQIRKSSWFNNLTPAERSGQRELEITNRPRANVLFLGGITDSREFIGQGGPSKSN